MSKKKKLVSHVAKALVMLPALSHVSKHVRVDGGKVQLVLCFVPQRGQEEKKGGQKRTRSSNSSSDPCSV
jgi:hypothetical protein